MMGGAREARHGWRRAAQRGVVSSADRSCAPAQAELIEPCDQGGEAVSARGTTARELRSHNPPPEYPRVETAIRTVTDPHGCPRDGRLLVQGRVRIACCHCFLVTHFDTQSTSAHAHLHSVSHDTSDLSQRVPHTFRRDATRAGSHLGTWAPHTIPKVA